jgi:hypothetical protein
MPGASVIQIPAVAISRQADLTYGWPRSRAEEFSQREKAAPPAGIGLAGGTMGERENHGDGSYAPNVRRSHSPRLSPKAATHLLTTIVGRLQR